MDEFTLDESDSDDGSDRESPWEDRPKQCMYHAAQKVLQAIRLKPQKDGIGYTEVAAKSRRRYELRYNPAECDEMKFIDDALSAFELMFKSTSLVRGVGQALRLNDDVDKHRGFGKAAKAIHKSKFYTIRYCWEKKIFPLKQELSTLTKIYQGLKKQFTQVRSEYLQEVAVLRDLARTREDPECILPSKKQADVRYFYDPVTSLSAEELEFVTHVVSEKLKMIFEVDKDAQGRVNTAQLDAMNATNHANRERKLQETIKMQEEQIKELKAQNKLLQQDLSRPGGSALASSGNPLQHMLEAQESHIEELQETIASLRPVTKALEEVTHERDALHSAHEREQKSCDALTVRVGEMEAEREALRLKVKQEADNRKQLEDQVSRQQRLLAQYNQKNNAKSRYLRDDGGSQATQDDAAGTQQQRELQTENEVLRSESFRLQQKVATLGSFRQQHAQSVADSAVADAKYFKKMFELGYSSDSSEDDDSDDSNRLHGADSFKVRTYSEKLQALHREADEVSERLQQELQLYEESRSDSASGDEHTRYIDVISELRRKGQRIEYEVFSNSIFLEAARFGIKEGSKLFRTIGDHCKRLGHKLIETAEANSRLVAQLGMMQQKAALTIRQLRRSSASEVQQGLDELEQITNHDLASDMTAPFNSPPRLSKLQESVKRLQYGKAVMSEQAAMKRQERLNYARMKQQLSMQIKYDEVSINESQKADFKGGDAPTSRWAMVSAAQFGSPTAASSSYGFGRQVSAYSEREPGSCAHPPVARRSVTPLGTLDQTVSKLASSRASTPLVVVDENALKRVSCAHPPVAGRSVTPLGLVDQTATVSKLLNAIIPSRVRASTPLETATASKLVPAAIPSGARASTQASTQLDVVDESVTASKLTHPFASNGARPSKRSVTPRGGLEEITARPRPQSEVLDVLPSVESCSPLAPLQGVRPSEPRRKSCAPQGKSTMVQGKLANMQRLSTMATKLQVGMLETRRAVTQDLSIGSDRVVGL